MFIKPHQGSLAWNYASLWHWKDVRIRKWWQTPVSQVTPLSISQDLSGRKTQPLPVVNRAQRRGAWQILTPRTAAMFGRNLGDYFFFGGGTLQKSPGLSWIIISIPDEKCHDLGHTHVHPNFFQTKIQFSCETFHALEFKATQ